MGLRLRQYKYNLLLFSQLRSICVLILLLAQEIELLFT
jgi:hypothetical protein